MKFLLLASDMTYLVRFRGALINAIQTKGLIVHVALPIAANDLAYLHNLEAQGVTVHNIPLKRTGTNPIADLRSLLALLSLIRHLRPDFVLSYSIKPVVYGLVIAWLAGVPKRFALITGLGYVFQEDKPPNLLLTLVEKMYTIALAHVHKVFFQNPDDERLFRRRGILCRETPSLVVNGSGVDLAYFAVAPLPETTPKFLLIARLLGEKGIREYVQAARSIRTVHPSVQFSLVGDLDENPNSITRQELQEWEIEGVIQYIGFMADVRPAIAACSVFVLPSSYREGTPRTILEAMAMGRPIITTDAPGCRETVLPGENGFLIPTKSVSALVDAMQHFIDNPELICRMGDRSRQIAECKYNVHEVNAIMLREMDI